MQLQHFICDQQWLDDFNDLIELLGRLLETFIGNDVSNS